MKRIFIIFALSAFAVLFSTCEDSLSTIVFNVNGGTGTTPNPITEKTGSNITLPNNSGFSRNGFDFGGWNTKDDGTGTNFNAGSNIAMPDGNMTLYARWIPGITITIYQMNINYHSANAKVYLYNWNGDIVAISDTVEIVTLNNDLLPRATLTMVSPLNGNTFSTPGSYTIHLEIRSSFINADLSLKFIHSVMFLCNTSGLKNNTIYILPLLSNISFGHSAAQKIINKINADNFFINDILIFLRKEVIIIHK